MTITRVGTNQKYASGWDKAFGGAKKSKAAPAQAAAAKPAAAKSQSSKASPTTANGTKVANVAKAKPEPKKAVVKAKLAPKAAAKSAKAAKGNKTVTKSKK